MASFDDDYYISQHHLVSQYYFVDEKNVPVSFTALPFNLDDSGKSCDINTQIFLRGVADDGLHKVYQQVTSWSLRLQVHEVQPEIFVYLLRGRKWVKLGKPRESYRERFRSIMITIKWLHHLKRRPTATESEIWNFLHKDFSLLEVRPSKNDLTPNVSLIKSVAERDKSLSEAKVLVTFLVQELGEKPRFTAIAGRRPDTEKLFGSHNNMVDEGTNGAYCDELVEEPGLFDSVCAFCDNGGDVLCCEGKCLRSFHATEDAGADSYCKSLGYTTDQVEAIPNFLCDNCRYKQHQCFACGQLGSSDKTAGAEVFPCASATCGRFYHPKCVAQLLFRASELEARKFQKMFAAGESFTCPIHKCFVCNKRENTDIHELQFAICRRCPTAYHRKCLPSEIIFKDAEAGILQRAWDGLLQKRILMYCMKHRIEEILRTPIRNHIVFPAKPLQRNKIKIKLKTKFLDDLPKEPSSTSDKMNRKYPNGSGTTDTKLKERADSDHFKLPLKDKTKCFMYPVSPSLTEKNFHSSFPESDGETVKRLTSLMDDVSSSLTLEAVNNKHLDTSRHASAKHINKNITLGKVESAVEAIKMALQKLEAGVSTDEAKEVCEPRMLNQMTRWRKNLKVYLAPFLHDMHYTSYGRHFTKVDKLKEIVDNIQWYIQRGDMVVDFCCGANDFSIMMKEKLDAAGKTCSFKKYDIIHPKNGSEFERGDWMTVDPGELPDGSKLVIGLNPPFGVRAALVNMFIDKALAFRPKLLILVVPKGTERVDEKSSEYDLIWEDHEKLSGTSFYLPGSIDLDDKQMEQRNWKAPSLYLWSRRDWTAKHKVIALERGHISKTQAVATSADHDLSREPNFDTRDAEGIATPGVVEHRRSLNATGLDMNFEDLEDGEFVAPDMSMPSYTTDYTATVPIGFAPGPPHAYLHLASSGGWLED